MTVAPGTKLESGPATLHLCNDVLVLARDIPPAVTGQWKLSDLRRYGAVPSGFIFEGGTRCGYCKYAGPLGVRLHPKTLGLEPPAPPVCSLGWRLGNVVGEARCLTARCSALRPPRREDGPSGCSPPAPLQPGLPVTTRGLVPEVTVFGLSEKQKKGGRMNVCVWGGGMPGHVWTKDAPWTHHARGRGR